MLRYDAVGVLLWRNVACGILWRNMPCGILTGAVVCGLLPLLLLCLSCGKSRVEGCVMPDSIKSQCCVGDIVLRKGTGMTSHVVCAAADSEDYSHCGIIALGEDGKLVVVHAVPDEPDFDGDPDRVKVEPLESFYSTIKSTKGCLLRLVDSADTSLTSCAARVAMAVYRRRTLFDHDYDDSDTTRMYCSQLVDYAYLHAGVSLVGNKRHNFCVPGFNVQHVILPSDFIHSPHIKTVAIFK